VKLIILLAISAALSGCISNGQGILAQAINNSMGPDVDPSFCQTMKGQPRQVFYDFAKKHKMAPAGALSGLGDVYPAVELYSRGNFRAAVALDLEGITPQGHKIVTNNPYNPISMIECWKSTDPTPPGRREYMGAKM